MTRKVALRQAGIAVFNDESSRFTMFNRQSLAVMPSVATMCTTRSYPAWHVLAPQLNSLSFRPLWQSLLLASSPLHWRPQQPFEPTSSCRKSLNSGHDITGKFQNHRYRRIAWTASAWACSRDLVVFAWNQVETSQFNLIWEVWTSQTLVKHGHKTQAIMSANCPGQKHNNSPFRNS